MASLLLISKWVAGSFAMLGVGYVLVNAGLVWFGNTMSEGSLDSDTQLYGTNVLVALSDDPAVKQALLAGCHSMQALPASSSPFLASGLLVEVPSGTKMHMPSWSQHEVGTMTIAEGRLKGRRVWACSGQFHWLNAMP
jgi:hypothetical protein